MLKKKNVFILALLLISMFFCGVYIKNLQNSKIEDVLKNKEYSYLPAKAKEYLKNVYEDTDEIVLTEKNKVNGEPYLNPGFVEYLELDDDEKNAVEIIPDSLVIDYEENLSYKNTNLPSSYDLRNVEGKNFVSTIKNQETLGICWAFASIENVETLLMKSAGQSYSDNFQSFSIRQMDYATSTDRFIKSYVDSSTISCNPVESCWYYGWDNPNGSRKLSDGGNFFASSIIMANGLSLVDESVLPWNTETHTFWPQDIFDYEKSLYEVDSTIQMPIINEDTASQSLIDSYVNEVKNYIIQYGGPYVGTYSPKSTCGFNNVDGTKAIATDDCVNDSYNADQGHAMQIIGWDDNYEYSYCDTGTKHSSINDGSCSNGTVVSGKGAWILRNSWGTDTEEESAYKYVYLTFDSTRLSIGFVTNLSKMENRNWDNNYHANPWVDSNISNGMVSVSEQTQNFDTHNTKNEKVEKLKFYTASKNGEYAVSIISKDNVYNVVDNFNTNEVGIYTIDLSDKNIILTDNEFSVKIESKNDSKFYNDSISVFTSNVIEDSYVVTYNDSTILDYDNPLNVSLTDKIGENDNFTLTIYQKNLPSNSIVDFKIVKLGEETTSNKNINAYSPRRQIYLDKQVLTFELNEYYYFNEAVGPYVFELLVNGKVVDSIPIVRSGTASYINESYSSIKLHANNGTDYYETVSVKNETFHSFDNENISNENFFNDYHYIVSWNTKADGTGISYPVDKKLLIMKDMDLYAQWSSDVITGAMVNFKANDSFVTGSVDSVFVNLDSKIVMPDNNYSRDDYVFSKWRINITSYLAEDSYEGEQSRYNLSYYINYPVYKENEFTVYAVWVSNDNTIEISFDANGGSGDMKAINVEKTIWNGNLMDNKIKKNNFSKTGYVFTGWNTKADGSGTSYADNSFIKSDTNVKLYAQWQEAKKRQITFYSNDEIMNSFIQETFDSIATKLSPNTFKRDGYTFAGWNTKENGSGKSYSDGQEVTLDNDLVLYAQWKVEKYTLTFDANGGNGTMAQQSFTYDVFQNISSVLFNKEGYVFDSWNTKADGTGISYSNGQNISLKDNLTLYAQWSVENPVVVNKYNYDKDSNYIADIDVETSLDSYMQNIKLGSGYRMDVGFKNINNNKYLYTGSRTRIYKNNVLYKELINVVSGDTNGDGKINYLDYVNVYNHIQKIKHPESNKKVLTGEYLAAADMARDSKINYLDYVKIYKKIKELKGGN